MTRARPGSKWSRDGQVQALGREPAGGNCSGMMCACMSTIIGGSCARNPRARWSTGQRRSSRTSGAFATTRSGESPVQRKRSYDRRLPTGRGRRASIDSVGCFSLSVVTRGGPVKAKLFLVITIAFAVLLTVSPVRAELVPVDLEPGSGDQLLLRDTDSGLDWLNVSLTVNQTYDEVRTGVWYQMGFRHATIDQ